MSFRLYARRNGEGSWSRVAAGCERGLKRHEQLAGFFDVGQRTWDGGSDPTGVDADVGIVIGEPPLWSMPYRRGAHRHRLAIIAPNSSWVPTLAGTALMSEYLTGIIAPSVWAEVVISSELEDCPVFLWRHGIDTEAFYPSPEANAALARQPFRALHLCSTAGQRKGTLELIEAWKILEQQHVLHPSDTLTIVAPPLVAGVQLESRVAELGLGTTVRVAERLNAPAGKMREVYQSFHVLCQPSRAEGFGLGPLECRASGIPVVATACTGHADHVDGNAVVVVPHGPEAPIDDGPGAVAPTVQPEMIAVALERARCEWHTLSKAALEEAPALRESWSWERTTKDFLEEWNSSPSAAS